MSTALDRTKKPSQNGTTAPHKPLVWSEIAPEHLACCAACDQPGPDWSVWQQYLIGREAPAALEAIVIDKPSPLSWGWPDSELPQDTIALQAILKKYLKRPSAGSADELAQKWLAASSDASPSPSIARESLAWAYALPRLARALSPVVWWQLVEQLTQTARDAAALDEATDRLVWQWLAVELPLVLATGLPEVAACYALHDAGMAAFRNSGERLLTDKCLPHCDQLDRLDALLASWTRVIMVASRMPSDGLQPLRQRLIVGLRAALALERRDGTLLLSQDLSHRRGRQWTRAALDAVDDPTTREIAQRLEIVKARPSKKKKGAKADLPWPGVQCDTARLAVLRTDWTPAATTLAMRHDRAAIELELHRAGVTLARGIWSLEVLVDGEPAHVQRPWENVCWVSDDDVDYLEIETRLTGGVRVQRQMLLARQERFLYVADAIVSATARQLDYRSQLPWTDAVSCQGAEETREMHLHGGKQIGVALPLALPEWRRDPRGGMLSVEEGVLQLRQARTGSALYAPLWIDLDRKRSRKPLTWRQLTIAQDRRIVAGDTAVGYRVQLGRKQWLIYRSLGPRANRTLLGSNLISEFMLARFTSSGEADPLLEIE